MPGSRETSYFQGPVRTSSCRAIQITPMSHNAELRGKKSNIANYI